jgi:hypothetical protein
VGADDGRARIPLVLLPGVRAGRASGRMLKPDLLRIWLDVQAALQEQHEEVELIGSSVVRGDTGVCSATEVKQELGRTLDDLADDLKVVKRGDPGQAAFSQHPSPLQIAQRDRKRTEEVKADDD